MIGIHINFILPMKIFYLTFIIIFMGIIYSNNSLAQKVTIKQANTSNPIPYVSAFDFETNKWYISDSTGNFLFNFSEPRKIILEILGYEKKTIQVNKDSIVFLQPNAINLNEVVVSSKTKNFKYKTYKSKNNPISVFAYKYSKSSNYKNKIARLIQFRDTFNEIKKVSIDAKIFGNENNQFVRLRLYKIDYDGDKLNASIYQNYLNTSKEIYSLELKDTYPDPQRNLTFSLPDGIILSSGHYLFSIEVTPSQNASQNLIINFNKDNYANTFFRKDKSWYKDFDNGKFLNMRIKIDYKSL
jgi:hypothetical protein